MSTQSSVAVAVAANRRRWIALVVLCVGQLMIVLDGTVVNVALPTIQANLHFSQSSLAWIVNAYLITFGGLLLLAGRLGDLIGPKKVFITGLALFTSASAFCGLSHSQVQLISARFIQGIGAAVVASTILGILVTLFPEPRERAKAIGVYSFVASAGGAIGLLVGGVLTQSLSWHWIFFINVPIGIAALVLGVILIEEHEGTGIKNGVDVFGALLVTAAVMALVYAIVKASEIGWGSPRTIIVGAISLVLFVAFVQLESRLRHPLVPMRIFSSRNLSGGNLIRLLLPVGMFGQFFLGALYLQHVLGYSPIGTGLAYLPMNVTIGTFSLVLTVKVMGRFGAKACALAGLGLIAIGLLVFSGVPVHGNYLDSVLPGMALFGIGAGLTFTPSVALSMSDVRPADSGLASGLANVSIQIGAAIGTAVLASVSTSRTNSLIARGLSERAALAGGYHVGYFIAAGAIVVAAVIAFFVVPDWSVGRAHAHGVTTDSAEFVGYEAEVGM